jgi:hypothetical protein
MAAKTAYNPKLLEASPAKPMNTRECLVHTSATYKAGQFLKLVAGLIKTSTTSAANGTGADAIQFYALTELANAIGNSTTVKRVGVVHEDDVYEMNATANNVTTTSIGVQCSLNVASNICTADTTDTTNVVFEIVNPVYAERSFQDTSSDTLSRITVSVLDTAIYTVAS